MKLEPKCQICGDRGLVPRGYMEPEVGATAGKQMVKCPKCRQINNGSKGTIVLAESILSTQNETREVGKC